MSAEELPLEMRIDVQIRDVLIRHRTTAWAIMEQDILDGIKRQMWCCSQECGYDVSETTALSEWLYAMYGRCLRPEPSEAEAESERAFMRLLREYQLTALKVMADRADDLNKHLWYESEAAGRDIGREAALDDWIKKYTWYLGNRELMEIEYAYKRGEFSRDEQDLYEFIRTRKQEIEECRKSWQGKLRPERQISLLDATKLLFFEKKTVNPRRDIELQREDIQREIERQQAIDEDTRTRIVLDYKQRVAPCWRDRKVKAIEYIITIHKDKVLKLLNESPQPEYSTVA